MTPEFSANNDVLARDILTVTQLNHAVAQLLACNIPALWVRGEISNFTQAASGHWYFTLKDDRAAVRAVMFRGRASGVGFVPNAGDQVDIRVQASLYEPRGDYQLQVETMRKAGLGGLYEAFLRLKERLSAEGLFDVARKRALVTLPRAIGVVTSLQAAALRDVLSALARRAPQVPVIVYPAAVQGTEAAAQLAAQVRQANIRAEVDTLLLVRGGGSMEDLWSFNDEALARAVAQSQIPVVAGVGHETDFTIVDFVADLRAPTPTAAAELACTPRTVLLERVAQLAQTMTRVQYRYIDYVAQRVDRASAQLISPAQRLAHQRERLNSLSFRLVQAWSVPQSRRQARLHLLTQRLVHRTPDMRQHDEHTVAASRQLAQALTRRLALTRSRLEAASIQLRALNPDHTLSRGYAIVRDPTGRIVSDVSQLSPGAKLDLRLAQGEASVVVQALRSTQPNL